MYQRYAFPLPKASGLNAQNMNYACVIYGGTMLFALVYYAVPGREWFRGPRVSVEYLIHPEGHGHQSRVGLSSKGSDLLVD